MLGEFILDHVKKGICKKCGTKSAIYEDTSKEI